MVVMQPRSCQDHGIAQPTVKTGNFEKKEGLSNGKFGAKIRTQLFPPKSYSNFLHQQLLTVNRNGKKLSREETDVHSKCGRF
jgi:hypothetical protein